jgi:hypothetical protein
MRLITPYAPGSFLKPCLIVSTIFCSASKETAVKFVHALNCDHAIALMTTDKGSLWQVIQEHASRSEAITFHVNLVTPFINGGSQEEWDAGWKPYHDIYEKWCPEAFREATLA